MPSIHFVEKQGNFWRVNDSSDEWESGYWVVGRKTAEKLLGGDLYLHCKQSAPSHFGGTVLAYRVQPDGKFAGRLIFRIRRSARHCGVSTECNGWGYEKKIVGAKNAS